MEALDDLRHDLISVLSGEGGATSDGALFQQLADQKIRLLNIFQLPPRSPDEQRQLESGKIILPGNQELTLTPDLKRYILFLAETLNCSERMCALLLCDIMREYGNISPEDYIERAIDEHHRRRRVLAECIYILTEALNNAPSTPAHQRLHYFIHQELKVERSGDGSLAGSIVKQLEDLDALAQAVDNARRNAQSQSAAPSQQGQGRLGADILSARFESLKYESRHLALALVFIARRGLLRGADFLNILTRLSKDGLHSLTYYFVSALFAQLSLVDPASPDGKWRDQLATDSTLLRQITTLLYEPRTVWQTPSLKFAVCLKWTMFGTSYRRRVPTAESTDGFKAYQLEKALQDSIKEDGFQWLAEATMHIGRPKDVPALLTNVRYDKFEPREVEPVIRQIVLEEFAKLVQSILVIAPSELRKLKQRQEDAALSRAGYTRNDIPVLYSFVGALYSCLDEDEALQFWGAVPQRPLSFTEQLEVQAGKLPAFLQWSVWSISPQDITSLTALYDMLTGLAKGKQCSELAYEVLASPDTSAATVALSWDAIFGRLEAWSTSSGAVSRPPVPSHFGQSFVAPPPSAPTLNPRDVIMAQAFLRLLSTVVTHSVAARAAIASQAHWRAIPSMVSLLPLSVPLELKGALFDTLSSFCSPGAGGAGVEICRSTWTLLERHEVINVRPSMGMMAVKGVEVELEEVEAVHAVYPATIPFLELLATLLHTTKRSGKYGDPLGVSTIPETLGQPYRLPGIVPYTRFVVDNVFLRISQREYVKMEERWRMNDGALKFIERALGSYALEGLVAAGGEVQGDILEAMMLHPGYTIMQRLLTPNDIFQQQLVAYIQGGCEGFAKGVAKDQPLFGSTMTRVLRVIERVLEIQDVFLDVLVPLLASHDRARSVGEVKRRSDYSHFYDILKYNSATIPALATYASIRSHPEAALLSVRIMARLSSMSGVASLIRKHDAAPLVMQAYVSILQSEANEDPIVAETLAEQETGAGAPDPDPTLELDQVTRLAVLDLLVGVRDELSHWLLFHDRERIENPRALAGEKTCFHAIVSLINQGVPKHKNDEVRDRPLFMSCPALAERCYHIIYALCAQADPKVADVIMRYLRTTENFSNRHLAAVPPIGPSADIGPDIHVVYPDGTRLISSVPAFTAFLRGRSWVFRLVALELQCLVSKNQGKAVDEILQLLFSTEPIVADWADDILDSFRDVGQSSMRIIELLQSLAFEWTDTLVVEPVEVAFLGDLPLHSCTRRDASECEVIDRHSLLTLLNAAKTRLVQQNRVSSAAQAQQLDLEAAYMLESCAVENHRRQMVHAAATGFEAWRQMLDIALLRCFDRLAHEVREGVLYDLLLQVPGTLSRDNDEATSVLLAEVILECMVKLREDRRSQVWLSVVSGDEEGSSLPEERLGTILKNVLECMVGSRGELVRGNLYAALVNYAQLISPATSNTGPPSLSTAVSLNASTSGLEKQQIPLSGIQTTSLAIMRSGLVPLLQTISRDAIDGSDVWKTVAYSVLTVLSDLDKDRQVLSHLLRQGVLGSFVSSVREKDADLMGVLRPDPDDLNPLYIYEAKMALFVRLAADRKGAEALLDAGIFRVLGECDFIDARPEGDDTFMDQDDFLPSAVQRYHQLLLPTLELAAAIVATLRSKHASAASQALDFLEKHSSTLAILLKNGAEEVSLAVLEEIHLIITLCSSVLPSVPKMQLATPNSSFGAINSAVMAFSTRMGMGGRWSEVVRPLTEEECNDAGLDDGLRGNESRFRTKVKKTERRLRKAVAAYLGAASNFAEPDSEFRPVLTASASMPKAPTMVGRNFVATLPSIGDALNALNDTVNDLQELRNQAQWISQELANRNHMSIEDAESILMGAQTDSGVQVLDLETFRAMNSQQKRVMVVRAYDRRLATKKAEGAVVMHTAEMLLLLLWRHTRQTLKGVPNPEEIGRAARPVLRRLRSLSRPGGDWAYADVMDRRLRETVGLHEDEDENGMVGMLEAP
ncbi:hypothetical protein CYLTODRAFT_493667 [Cylindrobasidium torrendii FP15055 ss-10]|uniref:Nucleoporin Nup186/Nup192/Nup205 n=1 Tax=Cylindrobasidium torrendii FP15055 ss-10 TaxID=1314674 RepID=A0A0D7B2J5_9AGAR|nr:hypothetical protein CYLTODRAFT_493667 [Cylindrobasidium torrendii FP15055 ss-10]